MISAPRKTHPLGIKTSKISNPYAWRQGRQLWSLFAGIWLFSCLILCAAIFMVHQQYAFFIEHAYRAFPGLVSYLEREEQVAYMMGAGILLFWSPILFMLCQRWTKQSFEPLIFFHQEMNSMVLSLKKSTKQDPIFPVGEFHEFYQGYQTFFDEIRNQKIKEAEALRLILKSDDMNALKSQLKHFLRQKESELGSDNVSLQSVEALPKIIGPGALPGEGEPRRRAS